MLIVVVFAAVEQSHSVDISIAEEFCPERFSWLSPARRQWKYVDNDNGVASVWFYDLFIYQLLLSSVLP